MLTPAETALASLWNLVHDVGTKGNEESITWDGVKAVVIDKAINAGMTVRDLERLREKWLKHLEG